MKKVFLWYPRRVWKMKGDKEVNTFSWLTWATDYTPSWTNRLKAFARRHFLKQRLRKWFPPNFSFPPYNPNAHDEFLEKWPTVADFIRDQRPICKNASEKYHHLLLLTLVRRVIPNVIATEIVGVQPMTAPVGHIFSMRYKYGNNEQ